MKRVGNLYSDLYNLNNIIDMTDKILSKVKNKNRREKFYSYYSEHIINIIFFKSNISSYKDFAKKLLLVI